MAFVTIRPQPAITAPLLLALALAACSDSTEQAATAESRQSSASAEATLVDAEAALAQAEAIRAIRRVQHAYAQYLSAGRWDDAAALFAADAVATFGATELRGRGPIGAFLASGTTAGTPSEVPAGAQAGTPAGAGQGLADGVLNEHLILSPVINIDADGRRAEGRWRLVALRGRFGSNADWEGGIFENDYVNDGGIWKISRLRYYPLYGGPYATGWRNLREETQEDVTPVPFHYDADRAGIPAPAAVLLQAGSAAASPAVSVSAEPGREPTGARLAGLEARAERLLDEQAITNLQNAYGYYVDRMLWDDVADLFAAEGTMELDARGVYRGRSSIRRALDQFGPEGLPADTINDHLQLQTIVSVAADGATASARGTELRMTGRYQGDAAFGLATFANSFVKVDGDWQIASMRVTTRMLTDYESGWSESALPVPVAVEGFSPDAPPSVEYAAYPAFFAPPFAFDADAVGRTSAVRPAAAVDDGDGGAAAATAASAGRLAELERRLRVLNAYDGAENVSNAYGYYIDEFLWDGMADVFSLGGWKELSYIGTYVGRERVRDSVVSRYGRGGRRANSMTFHQKTQPVISVADDGTSARIRTRLFQLNSSRAAPGSYISGIYENEIVIEDGIWRIQGMDLDYAWTASYDPGWANVEPGASTRFAPAPGSLTGDAAPDAPLRGVTFAPYPEAEVDMAFHYANPVSGRAPPLLLEVREY